jgi:enoyl-CoA hydratase/carnithine racemase
MADVLQTRRDGATTWLTLARPARGNALDATLVEALLAAVDTAARDGTQLLVFAGEGPSLCTGLDLGGLADASDGDLLLRLVRIETLLQAVFHAPMATLALAHGRVFGAGADLFLACRQRIADPGARFSFPGPRFGIALGTGRLAFRIGADAALSVLATTRVVDASEAAGLGIAMRMAARDTWPAVVDRLAADAAVLAPDIARDLATIAVPDARDRDLAALVRSASRPGLKSRIETYVGSLRK